MEFLQSLLQHATFGRQSKLKVQQFICREDLDKKKTSSSSSSSLKIKKKVHFESKPLIQYEPSKKNYETRNAKERELDEEKKKSAVQVKILVRREEACQLLSKCKIGGVLEFEDVANVLGHAFSTNKKDS